VPQSRATDDLIPRANSRQGRIDRDPTRHARGKLRSKRIADHVSDVMCDERCLFDPQPVHDLCDVARLRFLIVATFGMRRETHPAQIGNNHRMVSHQYGRRGRPHVASITKSMQHNN
jgi:hypothetical protein